MTIKENYRPSRKFNHRPGPRLPSVIESHGPSGKIRGNAAQLVDRYALLGKDALREGDAVMAEAFFQHAEHYRRLMAIHSASSARRQAPAKEELDKDDGVELFTEESMASFQEDFEDTQNEDKFNTEKDSFFQE
jgi:hypothetical protein